MTLLGSLCESAMEASSNIPSLIDGVTAGGSSTVTGLLFCSGAISGFSALGESSITSVTTGSSSSNLSGLLLLLLPAIQDI